MLRAKYFLHTIGVEAIPILDLRTDEALAHVGLTRADIEDPDWTACQSVGNAAWFLGHAGVLAPSATGEGVVLAAFETRASPFLTLSESEALTPERFNASRESQ